MLCRKPCTVLCCEHHARIEASVCACCIKVCVGCVELVVGHALSLLHQNMGCIVTSLLDWDPVVGSPAVHYCSLEV